MIEARGTTNYHIITALAVIYDKTPDEIAALAEPPG